jgi:KUP system potassium uptake protein
MMVKVVFFSLYALVRRFGKKLAIPTIIGATALLADGIITPPISVASAVEGLTMIKGMENIPTVPIVVIILSLLFFFQRWGTQKVGKHFWPGHDDLVQHALRVRLRANFKISNGS